MEKWEQLIEILLDERVSDAERDDAAMALSEYNQGNVIEALMITAKHDKTDDMIKASCGESLAMIFIKNDRFEQLIYKKLRGIAKTEFDSIIHSNRNDWRKYLDMEISR